MVNRLKGEFEAKDPIMSKYLEKAKAIIARLDYFDIQHVPREKNSWADALSRLATATSNPFNWTFTEFVQSPNINDPLDVDPVEKEPS